jgi:flagellar hook protein FlgE
MTELCRLYGTGAGSVATPSPPVNGATVDLIMDPPVDLAYPGRPGTEPAVATAAIPSANLGLSSVSFNLNGGKIGGLITLDELTAINIGADGTVSVSHADKGTISVGKISLANFANPRGLQQAGQNYYTYTVNSGPPVLADPGTNGTGALKANALEMSNVDLAQEFADMIVTQRGFQANTRIVSVTDQMLEELVNLKR